ncbi:hypothetical protein [Enterococcus sp. HY326]|uniref:hypothetical protein n=1 Tax=Enterococcus sp. HY326 TaxID=2971265 RepID=UPI00223FD45F|nr:hypothetical protein [Enterococcus sp. HY326]
MKALKNIIIFYDNYSDVTDYLSEMKKQDRKSINLLMTIIMNKYSEVDASNLNEYVRGLDYHCEIIYPKSNLGYLNGLLNGYRSSQYKKIISDWVIFSNTDIVIPDKFFLQKFFNNEYSEDIFCVAPSVYVPENNVYSNPQYLKRYTKKYLEKRVKIFSHPTLAYFYFRMSKLKIFFKASKKKESTFVYSAHGSYFILRSKFLDNLKKDYMSLLYSEEAFIAEEIRLKSGKIFYDSSIEVEHHESQVTSKLDLNKKSYYISESLKKIIGEYFD